MNATAGSGAGVGSEASARPFFSGVGAGSASEESARLRFGWGGFFHSFCTSGTCVPGGAVRLCCVLSSTSTVNCACFRYLRRTCFTRRSYADERPTTSTAHAYHVPSSSMNSTHAP